MRRSLIASLLLSFAWSVAGHAQTPAPQAAPNAPAAQTDPNAPKITKRQVFHSWLLVCATPPGATEESCEVDAALQPDGGLPPVAKIAFVRNPKDQSVRLVAIVQGNLTIEPGVEVASDPDKGGVILGFRSCLNSACLADVVLPAEELQKFRGLAHDGRLTINNAAGEKLSLTVPALGLDEALNALLVAQGQ